MNEKPLSARGLILPTPADENTAGGLIIPDTAKEKPLAGKVIAVGPGTSEIKMEVKVGDQVLYGKYAGQEINVDGADYLIMKQQDILAII
ncbi:co-chaperone GroES [Alistipes putredinis]|uniref:co-chaperone GroES n=1 Tax=Alistipes putredinis TaxID=28117 RepID=UPI003AB7DF8A